MKKWYYLKKGRSQGPVTTHEIVKEFKSGRLGPFDLVFLEGDSHWKGLKEFQEFKELLRDLPEPEGDDLWVLLVKSKDENGKRIRFQQGPFQKEQIISMLHEGSCRYSDYVWKEGMKEWYRISNLPDFNSALNAPMVASQKQHFDIKPPTAWDAEMLAHIMEMPVPEEPTMASAVIPLEADGVDLVEEATKKSKGSSSKKQHRSKSKKSKKSAAVAASAAEKRKSNKKNTSHSLAKEVWRGIERKIVHPRVLQFSFFGLLVGAAIVAIILSSKPDSPDPEVVETAPPQPEKVDSSELPPDKAVKATLVKKADQPVPSPTKPIAPEKPKTDAKVDVVQQVKPPPKVELAQQEKPKPPPVKKPPSFLNLSLSGLKGDSPRVVLKTDASEHFLGKVTFKAYGGKVLDRRSVYHVVTVRWGGDGIVDLKKERLPDGFYSVEAESEGLKARRQFFLGKNQNLFTKQIKTHVKSLTYFTQQERQALFVVSKTINKLAGDLKNQVSQVTKNPSSWRGFYPRWRTGLRRQKTGALASVGPKSAGDWVLGLQWMELKQIYKDLLDAGQQVNATLSKGKPISMGDIQQPVRAAEQFYTDTQGLSLFK